MCVLIAHKPFDDYNLYYSPSQFVQGALALAIFITHALACYVAIDIAWNEYIKNRCKGKKIIKEYIVRTVLVFITCTFAMIILKPS